jgi:hypothetical protein
MDWRLKLIVCNLPCISSWFAVVCHSFLILTYHYMIDNNNFSLVLVLLDSFYLKILYRWYSVIHFFHVVTSLFMLLRPKLMSFLLLNLWCISKQYNRFDSVRMYYYKSPSYCTSLGGKMIIAYGHCIFIILHHLLEKMQISKMDLLRQYIC